MKTIFRYQILFSKTVQVVEHQLNLKRTETIAVLAVLMPIASFFSECLFHRYKRFGELGPAVPMLLGAAVC